MRWIYGLWLLAASGAWAAELPGCDGAVDVGARCRIALERLHPTQGGVGLLQVEDETAKLRGKPADWLEKRMEKKDIPVVLGPAGAFYLVDRHHFTRALWDAGVREATVSVVGKLEREDGFWDEMLRRHWAWLYDEYGRPMAASDLPQHIYELPDYPYRTLAGALQDAGYISKAQQVYFVEFAWAQWLGERLGWRPVTRETLAQRLSEARALACEPAAAGLPGYPGEACGK